jgi:ubiquinone/menaquinone biosynthesis C-methylase UbiE
MEEVDLLKKPKTKRRIDPDWRKERNRKIAREFGKEFFDGERVNGYGGYGYDGRWIKVAERIRDRYGLDGRSSFLDVGCAKGFLLHDLRIVISGISVAGVDISRYAIENGMEDVKPFMVIEDAKNLPYASNCFDFVFSSETIHNLPKEECGMALEEMMRVSKPGGNLFIRVDAYRTEEERRNLEAWNLTAKTYMHVEDWLEFFEKNGYRGDYFWTILQNE